MRKKRADDARRYCGRGCSDADAANRRRPARPDPPPRFSTYIAKPCPDCGVAWGRRGEWQRCRPCVGLAREKARVDAAVALHRAAAKVTACRGCGIKFCRLWSSGPMPACPDCAHAKARAGKRAAKSRRRAVESGADADRFDPFEVFERDRWRCQLCGVKTPKDRRGTYEPNAPELDHILPLALGGAHVRANVQCACRRCNANKGAKALGQFLLPI